MKERNSTFPSVLEAVFIVVFLLAIEYVVAAAFRDARKALGIDPRDLDGAVTLLGNAILFIALMQYKNLSYRALFHFSNSSAAATVATLSIPILLIVPGVVAVMSMVNFVLVWMFPLSRWEEVMFERMMSNGFASIISTCILAPILEEMLFRGIMLRSFLCQYVRWRAILLSAVIFGLAHMNIYQFVVGLAAGAILGWLYERARSLWPCILLHAAYNSVVTAIYYSTERVVGDEMWLMSPFVVAGAIVLAFSGFAILRRMLAPVPEVE